MNNMKDWGHIGGNKKRINEVKRRFEGERDWLCLWPLSLRRRKRGWVSYGSLSQIFVVIACCSILGREITNQRVNWIGLLL